MGFENFGNNDAPVVEKDNSVLSEKTKALEDEEIALNELLKQEDQLESELQNAKEIRDTVHLNEELNADIPEKDRPAVWERQAKIKQDEVTAIAQKIDELNNRGIMPQRQRVAEARDALTRAQEG